MPRKTRAERLFGAACLQLTLERSGSRARASELYLSTLSDLDVSEAEVDAYVEAHRDEVLEALKRGRPARATEPS